MQKTLAILNELESAGLVERYAIGGAMAGFFYAEAVVTEDLDVFVLFKTSGGLISLTPIYDFLKQRGATEEREHLWLAGTWFNSFPPLMRLPRKPFAKRWRKPSAKPGRG